MKDTERLNWMLEKLATRGARWLNAELVRTHQRTPYDRRTIDAAMGHEQPKRLWHCPKCKAKVSMLYSVEWPEKELPETWFDPIMCLTCWASLQVKAPDLKVIEVLL